MAHIPVGAAVRGNVRLVPAAAGAGRTHSPGLHCTASSGTGYSPSVPSVIVFYTWVKV